MMRQRYKQRKYRKITAKFQNFGKSKKISRTLDRYHIHCVEARYAAGNPKKRNAAQGTAKQRKISGTGQTRKIFEKCAKDVV